MGLHCVFEQFDWDSICRIYCTVVYLGRIVCDCTVDCRRMVLRVILTGGIGRNEDDDKDSFADSRVSTIESALRSFYDFFLFELFN